MTFKEFLTYTNIDYNKLTSIQKDLVNTLEFASKNNYKATKYNIMSIYKKYKASV